MILWKRQSKGNNTVNNSNHLSHAYYEPETALSMLHNFIKSSLIRDNIILCYYMLDTVLSALY